MASLRKGTACETCLDDVADESDRMEMLSRAEVPPNEEVPDEKTVLLPPELLDDRTEPYEGLSYR